jgi:hypothetical protein
VICWCCGDWIWRRSCVGDAVCDCSSTILSSLTTFKSVEICMIFLWIVEVFKSVEICRFLVSGWTLPHQCPLVFHRRPSTST